jgi:taurine dioxygenase
METCQQLRSTPLSPNVGEEIQGIDFSRALEQGTVDELVRLLGQRGMIFARNQQLTVANQVALAERFGPLHVNPYFAALEEHPQVAEVRKEPAQKFNIGNDYHSDNSYDTAPALGSLLYAREIPATGGDTIFVSMYAAYDGLSEGLKRTLEPLTALHTTARTFGVGGKSGKKDLVGIRANNPEIREATHPVVVTHPISGRKALYVNESFTSHFTGWTEEESAPLLKYLCEHAKRPEYQCRLKWQEGTFALWDNRCTLHYAINDYPGHRRVMHRIQVKGIPLC